MVVVAIVVVGVPVVVIMVVVGPGGASSLYSLPLLLVCMPYNCILFVLSCHPPANTHTHKRAFS